MKSLAENDLNFLKKMILELSKDSLDSFNIDNTNLTSFILKTSFAAGTRTSVGKIQLVDQWQDQPESSGISYCSIKTYFSGYFLADIQPAWENFHLINWLIVLPNINTLPKKIKPHYVDDYINMASIQLIKNNDANNLRMLLEILLYSSCIKPTSQHST